MTSTARRVCVLREASHVAAPTHQVCGRGLEMADVVDELVLEMADVVNELLLEMADEVDELLFEV